MTARTFKDLIVTLLPGISVAVLTAGCNVEGSTSEPAIEAGAAVAANFDELPFVWFDRTSCAFADTSDGVTIVCGANTVTITDGQDGSACSASTGAAGDVTISCDDGHSATIPARGGDGDVSAQLLCRAIGQHGLQPLAGLDCPLYCPCFAELEILAAAVTGCRDARATSGSISQDLLDTVPLTESAPEGYLVPKTGAFSAVLSARIVDLGETPAARPACTGPDVPQRILTARQYLHCKQLIEDTVGPCETGGA